MDFALFIDWSIPAFVVDKMGLLQTLVAAPPCHGCGLPGVICVGGVMDFVGLVVLVPRVIWVSQKVIRWVFQLSLFVIIGVHLSHFLCEISWIGGMGDGGGVCAVGLVGWEMVVVVFVPWVWWYCVVWVYILRWLWVVCQYIKNEFFYYILIRHVVK